MDQQRIRIIEQFIDGWNRRDLAAIASLFEDDAIYLNIPMEEVRGITAIRAALDSFIAKSSAIEWILHDIALSSSGSVLTERTDKFTINGRVISIRVMGIFEFSASNHISAWRDYFDLGQYKAQLLAE